MKQILPAAAAALLLFLAAPSAHAQGANLSFGVHGVYDLDAESFGVGGQVRAGTNLGGFALVLNPSAEYYFVEDAENVNVSLIAVSLDLLYEIGDQYVTAFQPYFGAGLGVRRSSVEVDLDIPGVDNDASSTDLGLNLIGGAKFGVGGPVTPFAQAVLTIMHGTPVGIKAGILFGGGQ